MEPLDENHLNLIGSDSEGEVFLTEEEQVFFSSNQNETNYEDPEDPEVGLQNALMEVHRKYDLRSKKNQDNSKKGSSDTIVTKTPDTILKRTENSNKIMAKKTDQNKDKASQASLDPNCPSTSTKIPKPAVLKKTSNQSQQVKNIEKVMAKKIEANLSKL